MGGLGVDGDCLYDEHYLTEIAADVTSGFDATFADFKFWGCLEQFGRICPFS